MGLFVIGPVLLCLGLAITVCYTEASQSSLPSLRYLWLVIDVTVATLSVARVHHRVRGGILHLVKDPLEGRPVLVAQQGSWGRLPARAVTRPVRIRAHIVAFPLWTFTLIAGAIWAGQAWGAYWNWDPKEVWTFVIWVVYAAYLHARATSGWSRRPTTSIALAGLWLHHDQLHWWSTSSSSASTPTQDSEAPMLRYSVLRLMIFFGCLVPLWLLGLRDQSEQLVLLVVGAALLSMLVSYFVLRRFREDYSRQDRRPAPRAPGARQAGAGGPQRRGHRGRRGRRGLPRRRHLPLSGRAAEVVRRARARARRADRASGVLGRLDTGVGHGACRSRRMQRAPQPPSVQIFASRPRRSGSSRACRVGATSSSSATRPAARSSSRRPGTPVWCGVWCSSDD